ncbi:MAG: histidinol-phosphate transaminase [Robiginitomaculum sp.]|nr:histidinol-phosphate transaminase [Robiginitomaculum sp.]MDQ7076933.1 histidinol-phosphate transaminase [Robiginitomaculum sp.]
MGDLIDKIARPDIAALTPYSARGGAAEGAVLLDANENPWAPPGAKGAWNRYPEQQPAPLVSRIADLYGVAKDQLLLTRGADEAIDLLFRATCRAGKDNAVISPPTFGLYGVAAKVQGAGLTPVPLDDNYAIVPDDIIAEAQSKATKLVFLCSPNNPTGNLMARQDVVRIARECAAQLVVVDEAYIEFAEADSLTGELAELQNLVVLKTLSKAYGLAGARLGTMIANAPVINLLRKVLPPYPLPSPVITEVLSALAPVNMAIFNERIARIKAERERLYTALLGSEDVQKIWPSAANFLLVQLNLKSDIQTRLKASAIHVRDFSALGEGKVRISVGTPEHNNALLAVFGAGENKPANLRRAAISRQTKETQISALVDLDADEPVNIQTGIGFFDHMLEQIARHGGFSLILTARGDLHIDEHHTVEDCAIVLGQALRQALGDRAGIGRYGFVLPMDEAQARIAVDLSGRPALRFAADIPDEGVGGFGGQMVPHVFETMAQHLGAAIHIEAEGQNTHHVIEAIFKGFGRALRPALARGEGTAIPSSKGVL